MELLDQYISSTCPSRILRSKIKTFLSYNYPLFDIIMKKFIQYLEKFIPNANAHYSETAFIFFGWCFIFSIQLDGWKEKIEDIFDYVLLYVLVDHTIDDINLDNLEKTKKMLDMSVMIHYPEKFDNLLSNTYRKLITKYPKSKKYFMKLFYAEVEGYKIQSNPNLKYEDYLNISMKKGKYTVLCLYSFLDGLKGISKREAAYIGGTFQLIDDISDVLQDKRDNIHTVATCVLMQDGNLDRLFRMVIERSKDISVIFRYIIIFVVMNDVIYGRLYSDIIIKYVQRYNIIDFDISERIRNKIKNLYDHK